MIVMISKGGKVNRGWQEARIELAVLMVLPLASYKPLAVPQHSPKWKA